MDGDRDDPQSRGGPGPGPHQPAATPAVTAAGDRPDAEHARPGEPDGGQALAHARTLVTGPGTPTSIEIRAPGGQVELRVRITPDGPVLEADAARISLRASDAIEVSCRRFHLQADESLVLASQGPAGIAARSELRIHSAEYLNLRGKLIGNNSDREKILDHMAEVYFHGDRDASRAWLADPDLPLPDPVKPLPDPNSADDAPPDDAPPDDDPDSTER
ncbi:hypothetical protein [Haliangium sp.]|uniref:hypothetical protein n=1 Tax=Haliangium sp. TaxID=2663208 RepID=UPI003D10C495